MSHKLKVFIQGPGTWPYMAMFLKAGFIGAKSVEEADVVCFTGGEDVNPALYGERNFGSYFNTARDGKDAEVFHECVQNNKFMVGICRGGQFLNVMNGGKMWQDVDQHTRAHDIIDLATSEIFLASSTHHQMMRPAPAGKVLATAALSLSTYKIAEKDVPSDDEEDIEVVWYPELGCLCFQPHPEIDHSNFNDLREYFFKTLDECYEEFLTAKEQEAA